MEKKKNVFDISNDVNYLDQIVNSNYDFDTFIEGNCNHLARSSALIVAESNYKKPLNPFIIYSKHGQGKTHLALAIYNKIRKEKPKNNVIYEECEWFLNKFIESIKNNNINDFFDFYLQLDTLIIENIDSLEDKEATQKALTSIFDKLYMANKQMIFTTTVLPKYFNNFDLKLLSRLKSGLIVSINKPDYKTRIKILKAKNKFYNYNISDDVLMLFAQKTDSVRVLVNTLVSIAAKASILKRNIDAEFVKINLY